MILTLFHDKILVLKEGTNMRIKSLVLCIIAAFILVGCESTGPKTEQGAVGGGLLGAVAGGIIGNQSHRPLEGAAIGGAIGAVGGALVGNSWDKQDQQARAANTNYIPITAIAQMGMQGAPDSVIIGEIQRTNSVYRLDSETINYLKQNKVSDRVIDYMLATGRK